MKCFVVEIDWAEVDCIEDKLQRLTIHTWGSSAHKPVAINELFIQYLVVKIRSIVTDLGEAKYKAKKSKARFSFVPESTALLMQ